MIETEVLNVLTAALAPVPVSMEVPSPMPGTFVVLEKTGTSRTDQITTSTLVIQGNLLLTSATAEALKPVAQAIFETMKGVTYTPLKVTVPADFPMPAPGNIVSVTDARGNVLSSYIMTREISGQQVTLESTGNATRDGTAAVNEQSYKNLTGKMLEIKTSVDGLEVKASDLTGKYTDLKATVDGLSSEVKKDTKITGGGNLILGSESFKNAALRGSGTVEYNDDGSATVTNSNAGSSNAGGSATSAEKLNNRLTIKLNGTSQGAWDGSSAKTIDITAASVGATNVTLRRW